jgi:hypothetical protein
VIPHRVAVATPNISARAVPEASGFFSTVYTKRISVVDSIVTSLLVAATAPKVFSYVVPETSGHR